MVHVAAAAAAAKSLQSGPTLCDPGKNTGLGCHFLLQCMRVKSGSEVAQSRRLLATPWTAAYQAPPSMGLSRQEYWSGLPLLSPMVHVTAGNCTPHFCCCCICASSGSPVKSHTPRPQDLPLFCFSSEIF